MHFNMDLVKNKLYLKMIYYQQKLSYQHEIQPVRLEPCLKIHLNHYQAKKKEIFVAKNKYLSCLVLSD